MKKLLQFILKIFTRIILRKYNPKIVAITGSVGKSSTKEAVYCVLNNKFSGEVRKSIKSYNNEIGAPLTVIGEKSGGKSILSWFAIFIKALAIIIFKTKYPEILVLEMGADKPGDIKYLTDFIKPDIGIVTVVGDIPVHVEYYQNKLEVIREKTSLISALSKNDKAILNYDDEITLGMKDKTKAKTITYGFSEKADLRTSDIILPQKISAENFGISFKLNWEGNSVPVRSYKILGEHQIYSALAAAAVGLCLNMNLIEISEALADFRPLPGRMNPIRGIKNTLIIDDSYNSSPAAALAALDVLRRLQFSRKIAVLGDMTELGELTEEAHRRVGKSILGAADLLFTVGERAKFIADEARNQGFPKDKIFEYCKAKDALKNIQDKLCEGCIVLVKGSRVMKIEEIVREIMAEPERANRLLVN